jgi:transposase-like protein
MAYTSAQIHKIAELAAKPGRLARGVVADAAREIGIDRNTLAVWIHHVRKGEIPAYWARALLNPIPW